MNEKTRYRYEQRIKELERQVSTLTGYKLLALNIFETVTGLIAGEKQINQGWLVKQFRQVFK